MFSLLPEQQISYGLRSPHIYIQTRVRANRLSNSSFHNRTHEWNKLPSEIQASNSLADFKQKLTALIRPTNTLLMEFLT